MMHTSGVIVHQEMILRNAIIWRETKGGGDPFYCRGDQEVCDPIRSFGLVWRVLFGDSCSQGKTGSACRRASVGKAMMWVGLHKWGGIGSSRGWPKKRGHIRKGV